MLCHFFFFFFFFFEKITKKIIHFLSAKYSSAYLEIRVFCYFMLLEAFDNKSSRSLSQGFLGTGRYITFYKIYTSRGKYLLDFKLQVY